jgi:hypothetical protein
VVHGCNHSKYEALNSNPVLQKKKKQKKPENKKKKEKEKKL